MTVLDRIYQSSVPINSGVDLNKRIELGESGQSLRQNSFGKILSEPKPNPYRQAMRPEPYQAFHHSAPGYGDHTAGRSRRSRSEQGFFHPCEKVSNPRPVAAASFAD